MKKNNHIKKVAVLGAGVMGAQIAAHMVNCGIPVTLFDLPAKKGDKSSIAKKAIKALRKQKPAPLVSSDLAGLIKPANYDEHLDELSSCDLVIEVIAERMEWKKDLYDKIENYLSEDVILASNTSGLSVNDLAGVLSDTLKKRFIGMHFFNPPRYMHLIELIPCEETKEEVLIALEDFSVQRLGKGVVIAKDTPNFIANRIGVFNLLSVMHSARDLDIPFDTVDVITGKPLGRPKSGTFRTADIVGLDVLSYVVDTMASKINGDLWAHVYRLPRCIDSLVKKGHLGAKSRKGIYLKKGKQVFDPNSDGYVDSKKTISRELANSFKIKDWGHRMQDFKDSSCPQSKFTRLIMLNLFHYSICTLEEIAETARDVDFALRWGFAWEKGPFEIMQEMGFQNAVSEVISAIEKDELLSQQALPKWALKVEDIHSARGSYSPKKGKYLPLSKHPVYLRQALRENVSESGVEEWGATVFENESVRMWDAGSDVAVLTFKTKMGIIGREVLAGVVQACDIAETKYKGLILWRPEEPFSVGANLREAMALYDAGHINEVQKYIADFQRASMALKHCHVPTVAAVSGFALGGACELQMHAQRTVAAQESYVGLVEAGVGLLPAGGGIKELALRAAKQAEKSMHGDLSSCLFNPFERIAMGRVSTSAVEAKRLGLMRPEDIVLPNSHELFYVARQQVLSMSAAGVMPADPNEKIRVAGKQGYADLMMKVVNMREGNFISDHDYFLADRVATVITGGDVDRDSLVPQEWMLKLERDLFFELMESVKTQDRIRHMLDTGKRLKN